MIVSQKIIAFLAADAAAANSHMRKRVVRQLKLQAVNTATDLGIIPVAVFTACSFFSIYHTLTHVAIRSRRIRG